MSKDFAVYRLQGQELGLTGTELKDFIREEMDIAHDRFLKEKAAENEVKTAELKRIDDLKVAELKRQDDVKAAELKRIDDLKVAELKHQEEVKAAELKRSDDLKVAMMEAELKAKMQQDDSDRKAEELRFKEKSLLMESEIHKQKMEVELQIKKEELESNERLAHQELETRLKMSEENAERVQNNVDNTVLRNAEHAGETAAVKRIRDIPNLKQDDRESIEIYLSNFVRICRMHKIEEEEFCKYLAPKLPPSLSAILVRLPIEEANDFKALERAIFSQFLLDGDYFRGRFYSLTQDSLESAFEYLRRMRELLGKWFESENVIETYEGVIDFLLKNQFMRKLSAEKTVFLKERMPEKLSEMCEISDVYDRAHLKRGKPYTMPLKSAGNFSHFKNYQNVDQQKGVHFGFDHKWAPPVNQRQVQGPQFCTFCKQRGHSEDHCRDKLDRQPMLRRPAYGPQNSGTHSNAPNGPKSKPHTSSAMQRVNEAHGKYLGFENSKLNEGLDKSEVKNKNSETASVKRSQVGDNALFF